MIAEISYNVLSFFINAYPSTLSMCLQDPWDFFVCDFNCTSS